MYQSYIFQSIKDHVHSRNIYEDICLEEHHVDFAYNLWMHDYYGYPLVDNTTNELILHRFAAGERGEHDSMVRDWEILDRKLLLIYCI